MNRLFRKACLICLLFVLTFLCVGPSSVRSQTYSESLGGNLKMRVYYNDVTGNEALSFKTEGLNYLSDVTFNYNQEWGSPDDPIIINGLANLRATDDPQFQVRNDTLRLQNAYVTARQRDSWELTGGYFNERFTSYTMSTSLLGLNSRFNLTEDLTWRFFSGRDRRARPGNQYARYSGGTRLGWEVLQDQNLGVSYVRTKDHRDSLTEEERGGVGDTVTNEVMGVDYKGRFALFNSRLEAEIARSNFDSAPVSETGEADGEQARRVSLQSNVPRIGALRLKYERVDPNFRTISGFATSDRERYMMTWRNQFENVFGEQWYFQGSYEEWEDGLESTRQHKVRDWLLETSFDPQSRGYFNSSASFSLERREDEGSPVEGDPNESNRYIYGVLSENRIGDRSVDFDYTYQDERSDSEVESRYEVTYEQPFQFFDVDSNLLLDGIYEKQTNELGPREAVDRRFRIDNEIILGDSYRESLRLEQGYQEEDAAGSEEIYRVSYGISFNYLLDRQSGNKIEFSYYVNDNEDEGDPTQDYKEETVDMRVDYSF